MPSELGPEMLPVVFFWLMYLLALPAVCDKHKLPRYGEFYRITETKGDKIYYSISGPDSQGALYDIFFCLPLDIFNPDLQPRLK